MGYGQYSKSAANVAQWRSGRRMIDRKKCKHLKARTRLEKNTADWLKHYLSSAYPLAWGKVHLDIINGAQEALEIGGKFVVAAPRGTGKSTLIWGVALKFVLQGRLKFPALLPWKAGELRKALRFWKNALCYNAKLRADYPEYCEPFAESRGSSQKCLTLCWSDTEQPTGAQLRLSDGMLVFPDGRGVIGGSTINGNPRGLNHATEDGRVLRPDLVFIDDPQDKSVAKSAPQVASIIDIIDTDVMGMAGQERMPALLSCTVMKSEDVATHYLAAKDWRAVRVGQIITWPDNMELWDKLGEMIKDQREPDAIKFYAENKAELQKGMEISWEARFDKKRNEPDAYYSAMRDFYFMGKAAFMAERQNEPLEEGATNMPYHLEAKIVAGKIEERNPHAVPRWVTTTIASTDVNPSYALSTVVLGFGQDQTCAVLWYGLYKIAIPGETPAPVLNRELYEAFSKHGRELAAMPCRVEKWAIDAGGANFDAVARFTGDSARLCGIPAMGFTGRGAKQYKPYGRTLDGPAREQCHRCLTKKEDGRIIRWVVWNADYWKEIMQRAWMGEIGAPGSCSLFRGNHGEFARQVCGEKLMGKGEIGGQMFWNFVTVPGRHDFLDAMAQGYAAAAYDGTGTGGFTRRRPAPRRMPKVMIEE